MHLQFTFDLQSEKRWYIYWETGIFLSVCYKTTDMRSFRGRTIDKV